jgi:fructosamine-3-kinase
MSLPADLSSAIEEAFGQSVVNGSRVSGGDLNDAWRVELEDGASAFIKTSADAQPGAYAAEARGLRWLGEPGALETPDVLAEVDPPPEEDHDGPRLLALEWIDEGSLDSEGEETLGRGLARVHEAGAMEFGADAPLRLGPLEIPNEPAGLWSEFYAERRIRPLARHAEKKNALPDNTMQALDRVCERLPDLAGPEEPPARLHGDLWSGNVLASKDGTPYLIDPAAYGGHREIDLAMLRLFGGPSKRCFDAYVEVSPLADGHEERVPLWQLFPLLVHAVLFGGGYGSSVARIANQFA